jgi:hypothetical protein
MLIVLLMLITMLLPAYNAIGDAYGEASPVTCVVITNKVESELKLNYTVAVNPPYAKVIPGSVITFDVIVLSKDKENAKDVISLDIVGLPEGISSVFDPVRGTPDFISKLTISVDEMICPGTYAPTIIAQNTNLQLADFKLEVASVGSVRNALESEIAELSSKIDDLEQTIKEIRSETARVNDSGFAGYIVVLLVAVIGSFLLGAFALFVLLRHSTKNPRPAGTEVRLQEMIDSLKQLIGTRKQTEETEIKNEAGQVTRKEESTTVEPKVGDVWYAYCPTCGLRTEHGRDYEGAFCARCNTRST